MRSNCTPRYTTAVPHNENITDAGKTSYLADKTTHLPRYTTAVSRGRITRENVKRTARHGTPHPKGKDLSLPQNAANNG